MSLPNEVNLHHLGSTGYTINQSLRFRDTASPYLNRTPSVAGNRRTWTWSAWVKRSELSSNQSLFAVNNNGADYQEFRFQDSNTLRLILDAASLNYAVEVPTVVWRDPAAWYHIVLAVDTTQATSTNRVKIYVNGIQQTVSALSGFSFPAQNFDTYVNATLPHAIGNFNYNNSLYFNGYMAEVNFIDGQSLTPSSFGKTDGATGQWIPIKFGGAYGTNGFYLPFTNTTSTSTLGNDFSGNSNTWTVNNFSLTAGVTYDSMTDVPTNTSETAANYCVINSTTLQPTGWGTAGVVSNGNQTLTVASSETDGAAYGTIALPRSGKWYWEVIITNSTVPGAVGVSESSMKRPDTTGPICRMLYSGGGTGVSFASNGFTNTGSYTFFGNATLGIACDMDNGAIYFAVNGTYVNSGVPTSGASKTGAIFTDLLSASPGGGSWLPMSFGYLGHVHNHNY